MKLNRKGVTLGVATLGLAGVLASGVGVAHAATARPTPTPGPASSTLASQSRGAGAGMRAMMAGQHQPMTAVASYLGLSLGDLQSQLRSGKSLADIAKAQGKSVSDLRDAMIAAMKNSLDADTTLTAQQKAEMLEHMTSHLDTMLNASHSPGTGMGGMGGRMHGMQH